MDAGTINYGVEDVQVLNQTNKLANLERIRKGAKTGIDQAAVEKAAEEFEAVFLSQMLQHMFNDIDLSPMVDGGAEEDIYKSMLVDEYGKILSRAGGIGVAAHVKREMLKLQEVE